MRSLPASWLKLVLLALLYAVSFQSSSLDAAESVTVHLQSGRSFTGIVDSNTTELELILHFENGGMALWRPIDWERVVGAEYQGKELSASEFRTLAVKLASISAEEIPPPPSELELGEPGDDSSPPAVPQEIQSSIEYSTQEPADHRVRSIDVSAELANWNAGTEMDGLILTVWPLNAQGQIVPVSGTMEVQLEGLRGDSARSKYSYFRGNPFPVLGQWAQSMLVTDVGPAGAQFKLPFQAIHPEFNTQVAPFGLVQVRLAAPGHGTFAASVNLVRIRPFSPLRDIRQQLHLKRFFPQEQLTRTQ